VVGLVVAGESRNVMAIPPTTIAPAAEYTVPKPFSPAKFVPETVPLKSVSRVVRPVVVEYTPATNVRISILLDVKLGVIVAFSPVVTYDSLVVDTSVACVTDTTCNTFAIVSMWFARDKLTPG